VAYRGQQKKEAGKLKLDGEYLFDVSHQTIWDALLDPDVLAATMPGCDKLELVAENTYEGALNIRVGPVQGKFQGKIELKDIDPPNGYTMLVDGQGAQGFVKATAHVQLKPEGEKTRLLYRSGAQVGGRVAGVGQRLLDSSAKAIIKQSLSGLNGALQATSTAPTAAVSRGDERPVTPQTPSHSEFAAQVAKEVVKDLVPRPVVVALIVLAILTVIFLIMR
jgi:carbon monoxide dehydrogenase subunit G